MSLRFPLPGQHQGWRCLVSDSWRQGKLSRVLLGPVSLTEDPDPSATGTHQRFPFQKAPKYQNQLILGVMAVDVSLEDIKRLTPRFTVRDADASRVPHVLFTHSYRSAAVRAQWLLLCHRPQRIRAAAPEPPAAGKAEADRGGFSLASASRPLSSVSSCKSVRCVLTRRILGLLCRPPSSTNPSRWTSWTQSWRTTSKWRSATRPPVVVCSGPDLHPSAFADKEADD